MAVTFIIIECIAHTASAGDIIAIIIADYRVPFYTVTFRITDIGDYV